MTHAIAIQKLIHDLASKDSQVVIVAVNALSETAEDDSLQTDLIDLVARSLSEEIDPENYAPFWAIIILGRLGSLRAVPHLLAVLDTDWDIWMEAACEALEAIAHNHGDLVFPELEAHVLTRMDNDPAHSRLYVYSAIAVIPNSDWAKGFLLKQYEADEMWRDAIAGDLAKLNDPAILPILRRGIQLAREFGETHAEVESLEAYCRIDGMPDSFASFSKLEDKAWQERWNYMLEQLSTVENDDASTAVVATTEPPQRLFESEDQFMQQIKQHHERRDAWPLKDFCLKDYLAVRPRSDFEQEIEKALILLGLSNKWTVEKIQALINAARQPSDALNIILEEFEFPSPQAFEKFSKLFMTLWNTTPREEFQGLSPSEKRAAVDHTNSQTIISQKIPRNDPCPCSSGKKYKKCHGQ